MMTLHGGGASGGGRTLCRVRKERREGTGGEGRAFGCLIARNIL